MVSDNNTLISINAVSRIYPMGDTQVKALDNVSLDIYRGELLVIIGPSGSGKSTLLNLIGGMDRPTFGTISVNNTDISKLSDRALTYYRRDEIGFIFQFYNLLPTLTAKENVEVSTEIAKQPLDAMQALKIVQLQNYGDHFPSQMSGGEQQRVAIARALASNPPILLCDEPTGALDSKTGRVVLNSLASINKQLNKTVIIITHNQKISQLANRIVKLHDGKIEQIITQDSPATADEIEW